MNRVYSFDEFPETDVEGTQGDDPQTNVMKRRVFIEVKSHRFGISKKVWVESPVEEVPRKR